MGFNTDDLELSSDFQPVEGEANFAPTITREVVGGAHIALIVLRLKVMITFLRTGRLGCLATMSQGHVLCGLRMV